MPTLDPNQDHKITLEEGIEMTSNYRNSESFNGKYGGFFGRETLLTILNQDNCAGIRYYYGINDENEPVIVLVGATEDNRDQVDGDLAEMSTPCPAFCDEDSPLRND